MATLIAGIVAVIVLYAALNAFRRIDPRVLARALKLSGGIISLASAAFIGVRGNLPVAIPLGLFGLGLLGWAPFGPAGFSSRTTRGAGRQSKVRSAFLDMTLDHDTGALTGDIIAGPHAGRSLSEFDLAALLELMGGFDDESRALLAGYLDRRFAGWRDNVEQDAAAGFNAAPARGKMTQQEAYQILGLQPGADRKAITAAHHTLMKKLHPDQGGSTYLAARVNEAREILMQRHRS